MIDWNSGLRRWGLIAALLVLAPIAQAQTRSGGDRNEEFGPNVRAYLQYLHDEEEVVDDRISRREIRRDYYLRNMNRIRALRLVALQIARSSGNDFMPELEAVAPDELGTIFETPPVPSELKSGEVLHNTFRYWGRVKTGQIYYVFVRLDPYEQEELLERERRAKAANGVAGTGDNRTPPEPKPNETP